MIATCPVVKKWKFGWTGVTRGSREHFGEFWDPFHISATVEARNLKFGTQIDREVPYRKKWPIFRILGSNLYLGSSWSEKLEI